MRIGLNWPYDSRATEQTWALFRALDPTEITISSHESDALYERLLDEYPGDRLVWHIRMKGNRAWWPQDVYSVEYANERSLVNRCEWLIARGVIPYVILGNEPDIELAAEPVDNDGNRAHAADTYLRWCGRAIKELRSSFGDQVKIALAPLSQGNPDRFAYWYGRYQSSGLLGQVDFWACHAYTNGAPYTDPNWGGQPLAIHPPGLRISICETNDNGAYAAQDPHERAADYAGYADFLSDIGAVESLSIFTLPGGAQDASKPPWWFIGPEIVDAVHDALSDQPADPPIVPPPVVPTVPNLIRAVDVSSHQPASLQALHQWIAEGCQLLVVKSYQRAESAALAKTTRDHVIIAQAAGCWTLPYVWLYRSVDPRESVRTSLELFRSIGEQPRIMFLDCESYEPGAGQPIDPGPTVEQIMAAASECRAQGVASVIYSGNWWLATIEGDTSQLAHMALWLASYNGQPDLDVVAPFGMWLVGHQYTSSPVDWSVFDLAALTLLAQQPAPPPVTPPASTPDWIKRAIAAELATIDAGLATIQGARDRLATLV